MIGYNLAILIDGLEGHHFYSPLFGECAFEGIDGNLLKFSYVYHGEKRFVYFNCYGHFVGILKREYNNMFFSDDIISHECLIFPAKELREWSKFIRPRKDLKKGSVILFKHNKDVNYFKVGFYCGIGKISMDKSLSNAMEAEIIIPFDKIDKNNLTYKDYDNYGTLNEYPIYEQL